MLGFLESEQKEGSETDQDGSEIMWSAFNLGLSFKLHLHSNLDGNKSYSLEFAC